MINKAKLRAILSNQKRKVKGIRPSKSIEIAYRKTLVKIIKDIAAFNLSFARSAGLVHDSLRADYDTAFRAQFANKYDELAEKYSREFARRSDDYHIKAFKKEIKDKIGIDLSQILKSKTDRVGRVVTHRIKENSDLIKSLAGEYKERARDAIYSAMTDPDKVETLRETLEHIEGVTVSRAELIARDQTQKVCSELNAARQQDIGVKAYYWSGIDDGRERDSHVENNGKRFTWDNAPEETGHPGEDVNCRCSADPDLEGLLENLPEE